MVPPFIAYFGALEGGQGERNLLQIAYDQCRLYRDGLKDDSGLWRHIALGSWQDDTHWATGTPTTWRTPAVHSHDYTPFRHRERLGSCGNASGSSNDEPYYPSSPVLRTPGQSHPLDSRNNYRIMEIPGSCFRPLSFDTLLTVPQQPNGALLNVIDDPDSFADTAATALLASVTYRMAAFTKNYTLIPFANKALALIQASVDSDGWLQGTVNPYTFHTPTEPDKYSPEGQAFVLLLHAAWRAFAQSITRK